MAIPGIRFFAPFGSRGLQPRYMTTPCKPLLTREQAAALKAPGSSKQPSSTLTEKEKEALAIQRAEAIGEVIKKQLKQRTNKAPPVAPPEQPVSPFPPLAKFLGDVIREHQRNLPPKKSLEFSINLIYPSSETIDRIAKLVLERALLSTAPLEKSDYPAGLHGVFPQLEALRSQYSNLSETRRFELILPNPSTRPLHEDMTGLVDEIKKSKEFLSAIEAATATHRPI